GRAAPSRPRPLQPGLEKLLGPISFQDGAITPNDDWRRIKPMLAREALVCIEPLGVAARRRFEWLTGIGGMQRLFLVFGAIDAVGDVAATEDRDRTLDRLHIHAAQDAGERPAITATEVREDGDAQIGRASCW